jgi:hypothetical protein
VSPVISEHEKRNLNLVGATVKAPGAGGANPSTLLGLLTYAMSHPITGFSLLFSAYWVMTFGFSIAPIICIFAFIGVSFVLCKEPKPTRHRSFDWS